ncbi:unnamed protein product [Arabis nemorensis]|uniref:Uncharacterized protein n=1 Tax=Arabis nemorensis TaxID=586526 RepID=A0A565CMP8_9BRAS|nr:unnamed protein product [Arabis nemorensis]
MQIHGGKKTAAVELRELDGGGKQVFRRDKKLKKEAEERTWIFKESSMQICGGKETAAIELRELDGDGNLVFRRELNVDAILSVVLVPLSLISFIFNK